MRNTSETYREGIADASKATPKTLQTGHRERIRNASKPLRQRSKSASKNSLEMHRERIKNGNAPTTHSKTRKTTGNALDTLRKRLTRSKTPPKTHRKAHRNRIKNESKPHRQALKEFRKLIRNASETLAGASKLYGQCNEKRHGEQTTAAYDRENIQ